VARKSKYQTLAEHLAAFEGVEWRATFAEVEAAMDAPLPKAARAREDWWEAADTRQSQAWLEAGWEVVRADVEDRTVTFRRRPVDAAPETPEKDVAPWIPITAWAVLGGLLLTLGAVAVQKRSRKRPR
jgi:hypothetical protein